MYWKILIFDYPDDKKLECSYVRLAVAFDQGIQIINEIKDVLKRNNFTQKDDSYLSWVWVHSVGLGACIDLNVDGHLSKEYKVVTIDELAAILPSITLGRRLSE